MLKAVVFLPRLARDHGFRSVSGSTQSGAPATKAGSHGSARQPRSPFQRDKCLCPTPSGERSHLPSREQLVFLAMSKSETGPGPVRVGSCLGAWPTWVIDGQVPSGVEGPDTGECRETALQERDTATSIRRAAHPQPEQRAPLTLPGPAASTRSQGVDAPRGSITPAARLRLRRAPATAAASHRCW